MEEPRGIHLILTMVASVMTAGLTAAAAVVVLVEDTREPEEQLRDVVIRGLESASGA